MINLQEIQKILERLGFSEKEAHVYLILLELQEALPSLIARKAAMKRPTVYAILDQLQKKGLISSVKKDGSLFYRANKPEIFIESEKRRLEGTTSALNFLSHALPELVSLHSKYNTTPQMSVYHGKEGLIQIMEDTLTTKTELLCWSNIKENVYTVLEDYYPTYIKKKVKNKIWLRGIFLYEKEALEFKKRGKKELREVYLIPKEEFFFNNEINIYDDKVAIVSSKDQVGVIIQNEYIANTQRAIFKLAFDRAKELEKEVLSKEDVEYLELSN